MARPKSSIEILRLCPAADALLREYRERREEYVAGMPEPGILLARGDCPRALQGYSLAELRAAMAFLLRLGLATCDE